MDGLSDSGSGQAARVEILPNRFDTHPRSYLQRGLIIPETNLHCFAAGKCRADYLWRIQDAATRSAQVYRNSDFIEGGALYFQQVAELVFGKKRTV